MNSHLLPLFISYRSSGEKLIKYQAIFSCDHINNSHDHSVLQSIDITRRNLMLITLRAERVNKPQDQNVNSHLLPLFISYRSSGEKLIKYHANSSCMIVPVILTTTLFYKALILQGEIWCWLLLGLKELINPRIKIWILICCPYSIPTEILGRSW